MHIHEIKFNYDLIKVSGCQISKEETGSCNEVWDEGGNKISQIKLNSAAKYGYFNCLAISFFEMFNVDLEKTWKKEEKGKGVVWNRIPGECEGGLGAALGFKEKRESQGDFKDLIAMVNRCLLHKKSYFGIFTS